MSATGEETPATIAAALLDTDRRETAGNASRLSGLDLPGLYAWFIDEEGARDVAEGLGLRIEHGLLYAGQTGAGTSGRTLRARLLRNHLGGNTYGSTFRLSLASILTSQLALRPSGDRRMEKDGEPVLTSWMTVHLSVAAYPLSDRATVNAMETDVLAILNPPLNLAKLPTTSTRQRLTTLRSEFSRARNPAADEPMARITASRRTPRPSTAARPTTQGFTPEELARDLGLPGAKTLRGYLRREFPRSPGDLWSRWGVLPPDVERAVRARFGRR